jgi:ATPase family AAA domain-containing protein 1
MSDSPSPRVVVTGLFSSSSRTGKLADNVINKQANSSNNDNSLSKALIESLQLTIICGGVYILSSLTLKFILKYLNESSFSSNESAEIARKLNRPEIAKITLDSYEARIGKDAVVGVDDLTTTFQDLGGMKNELEKVHDSIVLPLQLWKTMKASNRILPCPTGVLLYGSPGTGKTLTARAIAKECSATFLHINSSTLLDKWLGESDKLVTGLFTLARKLAPTIIFIDEIDSILRSRGSFDHQPAMATIQSVILSEWDGLKSTNNVNGPVILVGATNRPNDIDPAFLRRLPVHIKTKVPSLDGRVDILEKMLVSESLAEDVDIRQIAMLTPEYTGSDLRELVRVAVVNKMKKVIEQIKKQLGPSASGSTGVNLAAYDTLPDADVPLSMDDFMVALYKTATPGTR